MTSTFERVERNPTLPLRLEEGDLKVFSFRQTVTEFPSSLTEGENPGVCWVSLNGTAGELHVLQPVSIYLGTLIRGVKETSP